MQKKRGYKTSGAAKSTHIEPPASVAAIMSTTYGSLRHAAETAVEFWPLVRDSFDYLTDANSTEPQCPFTRDELCDLCAIVRPMTRLTTELFNLLDQRFAEVLGNRYNGLSVLERVLIIDAVMVKTHSGELDGGDS